MIFTLANIGLPGTSGFIGELLTMIGTFKVNTWVTTLAATGVILSAAYALWLYRKVIFGALEKPSLAAIRDLTGREVLIFTPLVVLTILLGVYPNPVLDVSATSVSALLETYHHGVDATKSAALAEPRRAQ
jgi:NADH-quinone oxidoreductase subunit M